MVFTKAEHDFVHLYNELPVNANDTCVDADDIECALKSNY